MLTETQKKILHYVYDLYIKQPTADLFTSENIMASLQLKKEEYILDVSYLIGEGLLKPRGPSEKGYCVGVMITHKGRKLIQSQAAEQEPLEKKPPLGFIKEDEP